jgi:response regulator RpfG family c-di-GMP phosphodiesterase
MSTLPRVLCVDDEPRILTAIARNLRGALDLTLAGSGAEALSHLRAAPEPFAVVVSDMRMPEMNGIALLAHVRREFPDTTRILLTGYADMDSVVEAVNEGHIFRFLGKPCSTTLLLETIRAGVRQHELVTSEKVLLEQTVRGSIDALVGILALASPTLFGRASRIKHLAKLLGEATGVPDQWQVEMAAQLAQIGRITLPDITAAKLASGDLLNDAEAAMVARVPEVTRNIVGCLPRLEPVLEIIDHMDLRFDGAGSPRHAPSGDDIPPGSRVLKLAGRIEELRGRGFSTRRVLDTLRVEEGAYDPALVKAYVERADSAGDEAGPRGITLRELRIGMRVVEPVRARTGVLLVAAGQEVTESLLNRIQNYHATVGLELPLWVAPPCDEPEPSPVRKPQFTL